MVQLFWIDNKNGAVVFRPLLGCPEAKLDALSRTLRLDHDVATTVSGVPAGGPAVHLDQGSAQVEHFQRIVLDP